MKKILACLLAATVVCAVPAVAAVATGAEAPAFTATDSHGKQHSLSDFKGKHVVLEWINLGCPFVQKHYGSGNMQALQKAWTGKGVVWLAVASSAQGKQGYLDGATWNKALEKQGAAPTALLVDADGKVGRAYGAKCTPHIFVIGPDGKVIYQGAIDDNSSAKPEDAKTAKNLVSAALEESIAGKPVTTGTTKPYGCGIKYSE